MTTINKHIVHTTNTIFSPIHTSTTTMSDAPKIVMDQESQSQSQSRQSSSPSPTRSKFQFDARLHKPSTVTQHLGPPTVEHDYPHDSKHRRHSMTEQERHLLR